MESPSPAELDGDAQEILSSLVEMYPGVTEGLLRKSALNCAGDLDVALDLAMAYMHDETDVHATGAVLGDDVEDCAGFDANARPLEHGSVEHLAELHVSFPRQGVIANTESRGITLQQLRKVVTYVLRRCVRWEHHNRPLSADVLDLYSVNKWLISPATAAWTDAEACAFVELLTGQQQIPKWFISHWWGELTVDLMRCVDKHAELRQDEAIYWICAYANRQHSLAQEVTPDPRDSSFYKAMQLADGVLLILDQKVGSNGPATPFRRTWCCFEQSITINSGNKLMDIATTWQSQSVILTDGVAKKDEEDHKKCPLKTAEHFKTERQCDFPIEVMKSGLKVEIEKSLASKEDDRIHILNLLAGRALDLRPPLEQHPAYLEVNVKLRARFALASWCQAVSSGAIDALKLPEVLAADVWRETLDLDMSWNQQVKDTNALGRGVSGLVSLRTLSLSFHKCSSLTSLCDLGSVGLAHLTKLRVLRLNCADCERLVTGFDGLGRGISFLVDLDLLELSFGFCGGLTETDWLAVGLAGTGSIRTLKLDFERCQNLTDTKALGRALACPTNLSEIRLSLFGCERLASVESLGNGLSGQVGLRKLDMNFGRCAALVYGASELCCAVVGLQHLADGLDLDFSRCHLVPKVGGTRFQGRNGYDALSTHCEADS